MSGAVFHPDGAKLSEVPLFPPRALTLRLIRGECTGAAKVCGDQLCRRDKAELSIVRVRARQLLPIWAETVHQEAAGKTSADPEGERVNSWIPVNLLKASVTSVEFLFEGI